MAPTSSLTIGVCGVGIDLYDIEAFVGPTIAHAAAWFDEHWDRFVARLRLVVRRLNRRTQVETGAGSPTRSEQAVRAWVEDRSPLTPSALAALEQVRPQSMGQTLDAVARRGWVTRAAHPSDRRQVLIARTDVGRIALDCGRQVRQAWLGEVMRTRLDAEEQRTVIAAIALRDRMARG